jgi:hypothetical protein
MAKAIELTEQACTRGIHLHIVGRIEGIASGIGADSGKTDLEI